MASNASSGGSSPADPEHDAVTKLHHEAEQLRQEAAASLEHAKRVEEENQRRHAQLQLQEQQLTPMTVRQLTVHGATNTRRGFLDPIFAPVVHPSSNAATTLGDVTEALRTASHKLDRLGVFQPGPRIFLDAAEKTDPSASPTDVDVDIAVAELPRYKFNAGTDVGNSEGSAFTSALWRNIFGGAEQLTLNASAGTRTRSAYSAELSAPLRGDPDRRLALELVSSATDKPWASHEEVLRGGSLRYQWASGPRDMRSLEYSGLWRQLTGVAGAASPTVRADAGDSVRSCIRHLWRRDTRDNPQLPQSGYHARSMWEIAGVGPLGGDVAFSKSEFECGGAVPVSVSSLTRLFSSSSSPSDTDRSSGVSVGAGFRFGMLWPLAPGLSYLTGDGLAQPSRITDRFQLGGPTDVRGFKLGGLGPHDGNDAVGGDVFAAGSVNALFPLPYKGPDSALRFQVFANGGGLVAMKRPSQGEKEKHDGDGLTPGQVASGMLSALGDLARGPPSVAAGVGLVYAHPVARFELNFSLPLVLRRGEVGTKGIQVGVGINFL